MIYINKTNTKVAIKNMSTCRNIPGNSSENVRKALPENNPVFLGGHFCQSKIVKGHRSVWLLLLSACNL